MSHDLTEFVGDLQECKRTIKDFGGQTHYNLLIGTINGIGKMIRERYPHSQFQSHIMSKREEKKSYHPNTGHNPKRISKLSQTLWKQPTICQVYYNGNHTNTREQLCSANTTMLLYFG